MIVRAISLKTGEMQEWEIVAEIPVQSRIPVKSLGRIYPKPNGKPTSWSTVRKWLQEPNLFKVHRIGKAQFVLADELPDVAKGRLQRQWGNG